MEETSKEPKNGDKKEITKPVDNAAEQNGGKAPEQHTDKSSTQKKEKKGTTARKKVNKAQRKKNIKVITINLLAMLMILVALPFIVLSWLDSYTLHGKTIEVPDISGKQLSEAVSILRSEKLDFEIVDHKYVKGAKENEVLEQRPAAAAKVKEGRKIELTMSSAHEPMQVIPPVVDNSSLREAQARLRASGFKLGENVLVPGEKDWVYSLLHGKDTLRNGMQIPVGSTVVLVIGSGDEKDAAAQVQIDEPWFE